MPDIWHRQPSAIDNFDPPAKSQSCSFVTWQLELLGLLGANLLERCLSRARDDEHHHESSSHAALVFTAAQGDSLNRIANSFYLATKR